MTENTSSIKRDFMCGYIGYIDAVQELQKIGYDAKRAETMVEEWEQEIGNKGAQS